MLQGDMSQPTMSWTGGASLGAQAQEWHHHTCTAPQGSHGEQGVHTGTHNTGGALPLTALYIP